MTPGARIGAVIEVLEKIDRSYSQADEVISSYLRGRRYIGSKDRRYINETVYSALRHHARLGFWTNAGSARERVIAHLHRVDQLSKNDIQQHFNGEGYNPPALSNSEIQLISEPKVSQEPPEWVEAEFPDWLTPTMKQYWGEQFDTEATALNEPAPVDLRVNTLKADCARALDILKKDGVEAEATAYSPSGLRLTQRRNLQQTTAFKGGFVEIQDEGSQLIALLTDTKPDLKTIDFCAGGGGKTLALAATMKDGGPLIACDNDKDRLDKLTPRLKRAGISNVSRHHLSGDKDPWLAEHRASAARVLIDVPCSGSGAWRRSPASKWRLTEDVLKTYLETQADVLSTAARLVAPGGRLIYATCSVLPQENEEQISAFLESGAPFQIVSIQDVWDKTIGGEAPSPGQFLHLTPARSQTDGFFCAVLERIH